MRKTYEIMIVTAAVRHRFSTSQKIRFSSEATPFNFAKNPLFLRRNAFPLRDKSAFSPSQRFFRLRDKSAFPPSNIFPILQRTLKTKEKREEQSYKL